MKITFIASRCDYANVLTEYTHFLNKHSDIECRVICESPHPFNYKNKHDWNWKRNKVPKEARNILIRFIEDSEVIIFAEETWQFDPVARSENYKALSIIKDLFGIDLINSDKKICIWHGGTLYRTNHDFFNNHPQRHKLYKSLYSVDLYRLSPKTDKDEPLLLCQNFDFKYDEFISNFERKAKNKPWKILQAPSNRRSKGTKEIDEALKSLDLDPTKYSVSTLHKLPQPEIIKAKRDSIFYIDQFNLANGGYGVASMEALYTQNVTFSTTNNTRDSIYRLTGEYETPIISLGETEEQMRAALEKNIKNITEEQIMEYAERVAKWLKKHYSAHSIIERFENL